MTTPKIPSNSADVCFHVHSTPQPENLLCGLARNYGVLWQVVEYTGQTSQLATLSHELRRSILTGIFKTCSTGNNIINRYIDQLGREIASGPAAQAGDDRVYATAHRTLAARIRTLDVTVPQGTLFSPQAVRRICAETQARQDENLMAFWKILLEGHFEANGFDKTGMPRETASVEEVRTWLGIADNQTRLGQFNDCLCLDDLNYTYVPWEIRLFTGAKELWIPFYRNYIRLIPERAFEGLENVHTLHLRDISLGTLEPRAFWGLKALTSLDLSNNRLTTPPPLEGLTALTSLNLSNNGLTSIPPGTFNLPQLKILNLENNRLTSLEFLPGLNRLESAVLSRNKTLTSLRLEDLQPLLQRRDRDLVAAPISIQLWFNPIDYCVVEGIQKQLGTGIDLIGIISAKQCLAVSSNHYWGEDGPEYGPITLNVPEGDTSLGPDIGPGTYTVFKKPGTTTVFKKTDTTLD